MAFSELKLLIFLQIGLDIAIFIVFVFLINRLKTFDRDVSPPKGLDAIESFLADADKLAARFKTQLEEKNHLIKALGQQLDSKIMSINVLLNRADALLADHRPAGADTVAPAYPDRQEKEIIKLAQEGWGLENIAETLSIPKGEVKLVLDLRKKMAQLGRKEGGS
ncbi:MAG: hypothetical protein KKH68_05735 [Proteobacteria bacterium]|nr:hypothetical protein [Pseudomonadota bacterium]